MQVYDGSNYLGLNFPDLPFIVGSGILPTGSRGIMFGPPKKGKSVLMNQLAVAVSHGRDWCTFKTNPKRILYCNFEVGHKNWQTRLRKYCKGINIGLSQNLLLVSDLMGVMLNTPAGQAEMEQNIIAYKPELVMVDPLKKTLTTSTTNEDSVLAMTDFWDRMIATYGITIYIAHHTRKSKIGQSGVIDLGAQEMTGVYHLAQWVDSIINFIPVSEDRVRLEFECRHAEEALKPVNLKLNRNIAGFEVVP
jgi:RecA-family ATPase